MLIVLLLAVLCPRPGQAWPSVARTVDQDPDLPRRALRGTTFHAEHFGGPDKPVVIVLHGGPGADYRYLLGLRALADDYQVVFYDQRGTGLSSRQHTDEITLQTFIDDLDAFVDTYGAGRAVHLLGHSWGAMLAAAYTGQHSQKVDHLILAEPAFLDASTADVFSASGWPGWRVIAGFAQAWLGKWWVRTEGDSHARDDWFLLQVLPLTQGDQEMCRGGMPALQAWRFGYTNYSATIGRMMSDEAFARQISFIQGIDAFRGPTLFIAGECNRVVGPAQQRRLMTHFTQARLAVIPEAGHFMFNDQPNRSLAAVRQFLTSPTP